LLVQKHVVLNGADLLTNVRNRKLSGKYLDAIRMKGSTQQRTMLPAGRQRVLFPMRSLNLFIYLILPVAVGPGVYSAFNRNEYQKQKNVSGE
jgi:hypothetical protein